MTFKRVGSVLLVGLCSVLLFQQVRLLTCSSSACVRVLFIGNSYTSSNDLPGMFRQLARAGGHQVVTGVSAPGGWRFLDHVRETPMLPILHTTEWQYVVLQEQSQIPSVAALRSEYMYPSARILAQQITQAGATPLFFVTWGHRSGWREHGLVGYAAMQAQLNRGYEEIAHELGTPTAPVGAAWELVVHQHPAIELWQPDGSHPSRYGTYLAACVFYATIFRESPEGLRYTADLPQSVAALLQRAAAAVVLGAPKS